MCVYFFNMFLCRICVIVVDGMERKGRKLTGEPIIGLCDQATTTAPSIGKQSNLSSKPPTN